MAVFRVEKTRDYTVMANHHLKDRQLSLKAKGLLSVMLSLPEEWDYTLKGLAYISREGIDAIRESIRELERAGYIVRMRQRNEQGHLKGMEYVIYELPRTTGQNVSEQAAPISDSPALENPTLDNPTQEKPTQEKPTQEKPAQGLPALENPMLLNTHRENTESKNKKISSTQGENPNPSNPNPIKDAGRIRQLVKRNLSYDVLVQDERFPESRLNEIVDLITETLCSRRETVSIAGDEYPIGLVREKLLRLNSMHIEYVLNCLDQNTTYIRNIKKYLLTALFNAPSTIDSYYAALVNHDLYGSAPSHHRYDDDDLPF